MKPIKVIVSDLDHTLLKTDKTISDFTIRTIRDCQKQGILFGIATARSERSAKRQIEQIKPDFIISSGGALARMGAKIIYERSLSEETSNGLIRDCLEENSIGEITVETLDNYYWNYGEASPRDRDYLHATYSDFEKPLNSKTYKITVEVFDPKTAKRLVDKYPECSYLQFRGEYWGRFAHHQADKVEAVKAILVHLGYDRTQLIVFGDDTNDIEMLKYSGLGVAVGNAIVEVITIADFVTKTNDEDGVAQFLNNELLRSD